MESLSKADPTLWGESAQAEASIRLGWTADPRVWSDLASEVAEVHRDLMARGINRVVLCGMGGSSLGPEVIAATHDLPLTIVDSTHPDEVSALREPGPLSHCRGRIVKIWRNRGD